MKKINLIVLGGGTAGWFTALFLNKILPEANVSLIESKQLGIVGVGEATTPHIPSFLEYLGLDVKDILKKTNGTIKNGIRFDNWNGDGKNYFHSFSDSIASWSIPGMFANDCDEYFLKLLINKNLSFDEYIYQHVLAHNNKIDLRTTWAIHFDATALANYLEAEGVKRGITVVDTTITQVKNNDQGFITSIISQQGKEYFCDFIFDCSGFHRQLIGQHYKEKWISYSKWLPMKKGIPFWLPTESNTRPYTQAIAMKYGWMWKIPLQHRIGSGYIFDSDYIDEHQALKEAEQYYGQDLEIRKIIPFEAGRFQRVWVKNCMAVGLSSSFLEPLESTSLWITTIQLQTFKQYVNSVVTLDPHSIETFNKNFVEIIDESMNFIYLHYMTKRKDSDFWKNFRKDHPLPDKLESIKEQIKSADLRHVDCFQKTFPLSSFLQVCRGLDLFEKSNNIYGHENVKPSPEEYQTEIANSLANIAVDHSAFLQSLHVKELSVKEQFESKGWVVLKDVFPNDIRDLLTQYALFDEMQNFDPEYPQELVPTAHGRHADPAMESVLLRLQPVLEEKLGMKLFPTYSYFRVYRNGHDLRPHRDRPSCEISVTACFNYDYGGNYQWPIYMADDSITLEPGDIAIYRGCDIEHGRTKLAAPNDDAWHVQGFFHYVDANGPNAEHKFDGRSTVGEKKYEKRTY